MRMQIIVAMCQFLAVSSVLGAEQIHKQSVSFNGVRLGDPASKVAETKRTGLCVGKARELTECSLFDRSGISYHVDDGHVVRIEARKGVSTTAKLPYGIKIGDELFNVLRRMFPQDGEVLIRPAKSGLILIKMIREPKTDYAFEMQLRFDTQGKLENVVYKDVM